MFFAIEKKDALREALWVWGLAFGGLVAAKLLGMAVPFLSGQVKAVAAMLFLYLPGLFIRKRREELDDYGVPDWPWRSSIASFQFKKDATWAMAVSVVLFPLVIAGFFGFLWLLNLLPAEAREFLAPYRAGASSVSLRLPDQMMLRVLDQFLVVALPEEFFYRGYLQTRLSHGFGKASFRLFGAQIGAAFFATQALFAVGHLAEFHFWRLGVFFPALLFGWLRERTGSITPGIIVHALSNLVIMTLEASAFGH